MTYLRDQCLVRTEMSTSKITSLVFSFVDASWFFFTHICVYISTSSTCTSIDLSYRTWGSRSKNYHTTTFILEGIHPNVIALFDFRLGSNTEKGAFDTLSPFHNITQPRTNPGDMLTIFICTCSEIGPLKPQRRKGLDEYSNIHKGQITDFELQSWIAVRTFKYAYSLSHNSHEVLWWGLGRY